MTALVIKKVEELKMEAKEKIIRNLGSSLGLRGNDLNKFITAEIGIIEIEEQKNDNDY